MENKVSVRPARKSDAADIARLVVMAWPVDAFLAHGKGKTIGDLIELVADVAAKEDTLYSYTNTVVAEIASERDSDSKTASDLANGGKVVGIIDYRSPLTEFLLKYGGNIGYSVRPSERGKGYAAEMLRLILPICRDAGEKRVLVTCDKDNVASRKSIVKNGGVLENEIQDVSDLSNCGVIQRFWIRL